MLQEIFTVVAPVFIIAGVGYIWIRREQPFDNLTVSSLVMYVGSPCLIYSSLTTNAPGLETLAQMALAALFVIVCSVGLALAFLKITGWNYRTYLPALVHPNGGNMGLPVVLLAFGETGLALGMAYFLVNSISQYTLGLAVSSGEFHPTQLLKQPVIWAVLVVVTVLARLNITSVRETLTVAVMRLAIGLVLGLAAIYLFNLTGIMAGVVLLQATMPAAMFNFVFAERYNREPDKVAAVILQSTIMSVLSLPLLVGWALTF